MPDSQPLKLFIIYAREDQPALLELKAHLRPLEKRGDLTVWYDGEILPGQDWDKVIKEQLATSDIVMLFISKHFFSSEYIEREELKKALGRHKKGEATVVPVIVKPCAWDLHREVSALQVQPSNAKPISSWSDPDEAFTDVVRGVQKLVLAAKKSSQEAEEARIAAEKVEEAIKAYDAGRHKTAFQMLSQYTATKHPVNPRGYHILGRIWHLGEGGVAKDFSVAMKWYLKAVAEGFIGSCVNIGVMYHNGEGVAQDYTEAVKWCRKAAEQGDANGQANMGNMYYEGKGVVRDYTEAAKWYQKAAEQGHTLGQYRLGYMYYNGQGLAQDYAEAVKLFRKVAEQGEAAGENNLGAMYESGHGVTKDLATAVSWYRKAAAQGNPNAKENLKRLGCPE